jgi:glucose dehydrogenase
MVVVGLTVVEPLAVVEVKVPGVMAMLVAPVVVQVSVLLEPELTLVGLAVKEATLGAEPVPEDEVVAIVEPQPARTAHASGSKSIGQRFSPREQNLFNLSFFL